MTKQAISSITAEDWKKETNHVKRLENEYWTREVVREREIEDFIIQVGLNSDSDSESDSECESEEVEDDNDDNVLSGVEV